MRTNALAMPNAVLMNPTNFSAIRLARENTASATLGNYLMGPPSATGEVTVWGLRVVESLYVPAGTVIVGDFDSASTLYDREQGQVRVGYIDQQFVRNMQTILAELRAAFVTYRPAGVLPGHRGPVTPPPNDAHQARLRGQSDGQRTPYGRACGRTARGGGPPPPGRLRPPRRRHHPSR